MKQSLLFLLVFFMQINVFSQCAEIYPVTDMCINGSPVVLFGTTPGGTWNGTGITNPATGEFNPNVSGVGHHIISYAVGAPCNDTGYTTIAVYPLPVSGFTSPTLTGCVPHSSSFQPIFDDTISSLQWNFGDLTTSTLTNPSHVYTDPGCYDISLSATSIHGCSNSLTWANIICAFPNPVAEFSSYYIGTLGTTIEMGFANLSIDAAAFEWTFSSYGTSNETNPTFSFPNDSTAYTVCLVAITPNGCMDTVCKMVTINSVNDLNTSYIKLYPNPVHAKLEIINCNESMQFSLFNAIGERVLQQNMFPENTIDVSGLLPGIYFYELRNSSGQVHSGKLIKE